MDKSILKNSLNIAKDVCIRKIDTGDIVVDCTMGNGSDTVFLARLVGDAGKVYAFDIQETAILNTKKKLKLENLENRVQLIHDGHENMNKYIDRNVKLIMFNLGYLPGSDHEITTKAKTTVKALKEGLNVIVQYGIIVIVVYYGHKNGMEEKMALEKFVSGLNQKEYNVVKLDFVNQINNPPELICIEKR